MSQAIFDTWCVYAIGLVFFLGKPKSVLSNFLTFVSFDYDAGDGLNSASGGLVYFYIDQVSVIICKITRYKFLPKYLKV